MIFTAGYWLRNYFKKPLKYTQKTPNAIFHFALKSPYIYLLIYRKTEKKMASKTIGFHST